MNAMLEINVVNGIANRCIHKIVQSFAFINNSVTTPLAFDYIRPIDNYVQAEVNVSSLPAL
jgi:hypothetical protein